MSSLPSPRPSTPRPTSRSSPLAFSPARPRRGLVEAAVNVEGAYMDRDYAQVGREQQRVETKRGTAIVTLTPPAAGAVTMSVTATSGDAYAFKEVASGYSPSGNFIHVEQLEPALLKVGDRAAFRVSSTSEARNFYFEVVSRDRVVFTGSTASPATALPVAPVLAPH